MNKAPPTLFLWVSMLVMGFATLGCSNSEQIKVNGTVKYQSSPVERGSILFRSVNGDVPPGAADIIDGEYKCNVKVAGNYVVEVHGFKFEGDDTDLSDPEVSFIEYIPSKFHKNSTTQVELTVGSNLHHFEFE